MTQKRQKGSPAPFPKPNGKNSSDPKLDPESTMENRPDSTRGKVIDNDQEELLPYLAELKDSNNIFTFHERESQDDPQEGKTKEGFPFRSKGDGKTIPDRLKTGSSHQNEALVIKSPRRNLKLNWMPPKLIAGGIGIFVVVMLFLILDFINGRSRTVPYHEPDVTMTESPQGQNSDRRQSGDPLSTSRTQRGTKDALTLNAAEELFLAGDYDACFRLLEKVEIRANREAAELVRACQLMKDPSIMTTDRMDASFIRGLIGLLQSDTRWRLRQMSARKLGTIDDPRSTATLTACLLRDEDWGVRCEAADSLALLGDDSAKEALKKSVLHDPESLVRMTSATALESLSNDRP
ncbi:HEAT repeat domain-containing protein [Acidobacteriota bacterium]